MNRPDARRRAERSGRLAELLAALMLAGKGYRIAARRFRTPFGEIDLVARRGAALVFVEVKARPDIADGLAAVGKRTQSRIAAAARAWLMRHPADATLEVRFDVIVMAPWRRPRHIVGAFDEIRGQNR